MASLGSQGERYRDIELPNPDETQTWEGENESVLPRQHLILQLRLDKQCGCYGNALIDVEEKPKIL